ncbi:hypothetical protein L3X38_009754 [Prunus dulcis]|uniref:Transposable element protein n=1 Tax=Prunus dulcis TaxID=3755 RepID=A0AAD4WEF3_PRUDU|nr:hypothetical protein L3X38_009754 [Prunus dulcis]
MISTKGIYVDPQKVEAVVNWSRPTSVIEVQSFLGLAGYYRRFVEGFSTLAVPLTRLTRKRVKFEWSDECEESFNELKTKLTTALKELNLRQRRWLELIKDYNYTIEHHLRRANVVADALSRKSSGSVDHLRGRYLPMLVELRKLRIGLGMDDQGALLATLYVENGARMDYSMRNDRTLVVGTRLYVLEDKALKSEMLEEAHCSAFAMHSGSTKTYRTLREHY